MSLEEKKVTTSDLGFQEDALLSTFSEPDLSDSELLSPDIRPSAERQLVRTLDRRLLPTIILIFIMNYIDVRNLLLPLWLMYLSARVR